MLTFFAFWVGFFVVVILSACLTNAIFWFYALSQPCDKLPQPKPTLKFCFQKIVSTVKSYLLGIFMHPVGWLIQHSNKDVHLASAANKPPVLMIHGIYDNVSSWVFLRPALEKVGFGTATFAYHSFYVSLETILLELESRISLLERQVPGVQPVLVGHSLGGILIRLWLMRNPENSKRIAGIITLATPHTGSTYARLAPGALIRSISPGSPVIQQLVRQEYSTELPCVALCTTMDEVVTPICSLLPPDGWKLRVLPPSSHFGLLFENTTAKILIEELDEIVSAKSQ